MKRIALERTPLANWAMFCLPAAMLTTAILTAAGFEGLPYVDFLSSASILSAYGAVVYFSKHAPLARGD